MWIMILKMAAATALYVLATVLLWKSWHKSSTHTLLHKLTIGLFYGLCSIASSHIGIDYGNMLLNVRDLDSPGGRPEPAEKRDAGADPGRHAAEHSLLCRGNGTV